MAFGVVQKRWSERIFYTVAFEEVFVLIIKQMNVVAGDIYKQH